MTFFSLLSAKPHAQKAITMETISESLPSYILPQLSLCVCVRVHAHAHICQFLPKLKFDCLPDLFTSFLFLHKGNIDEAIKISCQELQDISMHEKNILLLTTYEHVSFRFYVDKFRRARILFKQFSRWCQTTLVSQYVFRIVDLQLWYLNPSRL